MSKVDHLMRTTSATLDYLRQLLSKIDQLTDQELVQHVRAIDTLMNAAQHKLEEIKRFTHNEPAHERSGFVPGPGIIRVNGICNCGRLIQPYDFEATACDAWQAICSSCHTRVLSVESSRGIKAA